MKNFYLPRIKMIKITVISCLSILVLPVLGQKSITSDKKIISPHKNRIIEDSLYEELEVYYVLGNRDSLILQEGMTACKHFSSECGCSLPRREDVNLYDQSGIGTPKVFTSKAYPSPVVVSAELEIVIPADALMKINLFNAHGQLVQSVFNGHLLEGKHIYSIEMLTLPAGMYFLAVHSEKYSATVKVMKI